MQTHTATIWMFLTLVALVWGYQQREYALALEERIELQVRLGTVQAHVLRSTARANRLCESTISSMVERLGLDPTVTGLATTTILTRHDVGGVGGDW